MSVAHSSAAHRPERIVLAPMEGLADDVLRGVLTQLGGYDWCVSEFARVSNTVLPPKAFRRIAPELMQGARTGSGTLLRLQLMGSDASLMAETAAVAATLSPFGIDLNFGCPAPMVNRKRAGACLLAVPDLLFEITQAVRKAIPESMLLSAKMRLGVDSPDAAVACAQALVAGGAAELVVHARTRADMYRHPARWEWIARVREAVSVPVIANGDVFSVADWQRCRAITGCADVMLGRGAVADPLLARRLRGEAADTVVPEDWLQIAPLLQAYWRAVGNKLEPRFVPGRIKYLLSLMQARYPQADALLKEIRPLRTGEEIERVLGRLLGEPSGEQFGGLPGAAPAARPGELPGSSASEAKVA